MRSSNSWTDPCKVCGCGSEQIVGDWARCGGHSGRATGAAQGSRVGALGSEGYLRRNKGNCSSSARCQRPTGWGGKVTIRAGLSAGVQDEVLEPKWREEHLYTCTGREEHLYSYAGWEENLYRSECQYLGRVRKPLHQETEMEAKVC